VNFAPYVASINNEGLVAFQAELGGGRTGVYLSDGSDTHAVVETGDGAYHEIVSHPDINDRRSVSFYAKLAGGGTSLVLLSREGTFHVRSDGNTCGEVGPLGPTMNEGDGIAFRAMDTSGLPAVFLLNNGKVDRIASSESGFQGLPVAGEDGSVLFRSDQSDNYKAIQLWRDGKIRVVVDTSVEFSDLGRFPTFNRLETIVFAATLRTGKSGIFVERNGEIASLIDSSREFQNFRGALIDALGAVVFFATPVRGELGVYCGPDPKRDRILGLGDPLFDATIVDLALNPVSVNDKGDLAIRVKLSDDRQYILRAEPS